MNYIQQIKRKNSIILIVVLSLITVFVFLGCFGDIAALTVNGNTAYVHSFHYYFQDLPKAINELKQSGSFPPEYIALSVFEQYTSLVLFLLVLVSTPAMLALMLVTLIRFMLRLNKAPKLFIFRIHLAVVLTYLFMVMILDLPSSFVSGSSTNVSAALGYGSVLILIGALIEIVLNIYTLTLSKDLVTNREYLEKSDVFSIVSVAALSMVLIMIGAPTMMIHYYHRSSQRIDITFGMNQLLATLILNGEKNTTRYFLAQFTYFDYLLSALVLSVGLVFASSYKKPIAMGLIVYGVLDIVLSIAINKNISYDVLVGTNQVMYTNSVSCIIAMILAFVALGFIIPSFILGIIERRNARK